jgi:hypothetical protein
MAGFDARCLPHGPSGAASVLLFALKYRKTAWRLDGLFNSNRTLLTISRVRRTHVIYNLSHALLGHQWTEVEGVKVIIHNMGSKESFVEGESDAPRGVFFLFLTVSLGVSGASSRNRRIGGGN